MSLLETRSISRYFGGLRAVDNVDFTLDAGEIRAIIGPNGAGKTTFVSLISGRIAPSDGRILFEGADVTRTPDYARVGLGIAYTFQITSVFENLTCFDNVALAVQRDLQRRGQAISAAHIGRGVEVALRKVGLVDLTELTAATLAYGHKRLLEIAIGLALRPKLLILDEPTQGLSDQEIENFCSLVRELAKDTTILLIEHNMDVVMSLADRITVLESGRILAEGRPTEIRADPAVQQAYLGA